MGEGAFILAPEGPRLTPDEARFFAESQPFGFIVFARNVEDPDQLRRLTGDLRAALGRDAPVFIDQEGGRVQRLRAPHWREWEPPLDDAARLGDRAGIGFALRYAIIAAELRAVGIDGNCAPLGDIAYTDSHPVLRNRCYGQDAQIVIALARAVADALLEGGVLPVVKHIPGQGRAVSDSHAQLPRVGATLDELESKDFEVFRGLNHLPIGMTAHVVFEAVDENPVTISPPAIAMIRDRIGFSGLLMTDDVSMQALEGDVRARGQQALAAGCDLVLHCNGDLAEMAKIAELGNLSGKSASRGAAALAARRPQRQVDTDALAKEFAALFRRPG